MVVLLKAAREKAGLTQKELAKLANVPQQTISALKAKEGKTRARRRFTGSPALWGFQWTAFTERRRA